MNARVRTTLLLPAVLAIAIGSLPGEAQATSTTCSTSVVCAEYINTYSYPSGVTTGGVAIHGEANSGIGVRGTSVTNVGFYGASGSGTAAAPGVEGESTDEPYGAGGAFGLSYVNGTGAPRFGVSAYGTTYGIFGSLSYDGGSATTSNASGIFGFDAGSIGSSTSQGIDNAGVIGETTYGTGVLAQASQHGPQAGIYGKQPVGVYSVAAIEQNVTPTQTAYAFVGESDTYGLVLYNTAANSQVSASTPNDFWIGTKANSGGNPGAFDFDYGGNAYLSGTLTTSKGGPYVRTTGSSGATVREYATRSTLPNVEDDGEAQLVNGRAFVPIDARFGDTIDRRASYLVFVTPEGDCNDLFVTQKSASGFVVREMRGGRSSLAFQYRIVAKPGDENGGRLDAFPEDPIPKEVALERNRKPELIPRPLTPFERLRKQLGPKGYAKAMNALRARATETH